MSKIINWLANIQNDKLLHSFYGTLIYAISISFSDPLFSICLVLFIATSKEIYDEYEYGGFDYKDIIATVFIPLLFFIKDYCFK